MYYVSTEKSELVSIEELSNDIANLVKSNILNSCYPKGSIYMSMDSTSPSTLFGGTWEPLDEGRVLIGCNATYPAGSTGGEFNHTLTVDEMPARTHTTSRYSGKAHNTRGNDYRLWYEDRTVNTGSTGGSQAHNNMQPYLAVYMWQRIS